MTYAFTFDASACSGCKACQVACKDKNDLPAGVLWRRVYEVAGGTWQQQGDAWTSTVFSYNLSLACNHCVHPKCAGVCPTDAYVVRPDGIVYIDESKCMGCGYCAWACPYAAPQYHPALGRMTKCDLCRDNIDAGLSPACVAACPMRVLDCVTVDERPATEENGIPSSAIGQGFQPVWKTPGSEHPFPLPVYSRTEPHLAIKPHPGMLNDLEKTVSNGEEIKPPGHRVTKISWLGALVAKGWGEFPLLLFTLLGQMAAGMLWGLLVMYWIVESKIPSIAEQVTANSYVRVEYIRGHDVVQPLYLDVGIILALGMLFSFLHLGTKHNAWRALNHLKKSWLSREILFAGLFFGFWISRVLMAFITWNSPIVGYLEIEPFFWIKNGAIVLAVLSSIYFIHSMASVYRLRSVPAWNTWRTGATFFLSAGILGLTGIGLAAQGIRLQIILDIAGVGFWILLVLLLAIQLALVLSAKEKAYKTASRLRVALIMAGMAGAGIVFLLPGEIRSWTSVLIFLIVLAEEIIGRWHFYASRTSTL
jgi:anaerobic dimethyl sulfoxide reductase subunit B